MPNKISMPLASWESLKKIIRAYRQVDSHEKPTVEDVAKYAGMLRPVVSANNNFLREVGIVNEGENKLSALGLRLSDCLALENDDLIAEALQDVVRANSVLNQFVGIVRARGEVKTELLRGEIALASNLADRTKQPSATKAILDMLQEAKVLQVNDDIVRPAAPVPIRLSDMLANFPAEVRTTDRDAAPLSESKRVKTDGDKDVQLARIPLPLGPSRLAYIQLPDKWESKELPKLIKILQIALGDDSET